MPSPGSIAARFGGIDRELTYRCSSSISNPFQQFEKPPAPKRKRRAKSEPMEAKPRKPRQPRTQIEFTPEEIRACVDPNCVGAIAEVARKYNLRWSGVAYRLKRLDCGYQAVNDKKIMKLTKEQLQDCFERAPKVGIAALCREYDVPWSTLFYRLKKMGYQHMLKLSPEQIQSAIERNSHPLTRHTTGRISVLAHEFGVSISCVVDAFKKAGYNPPKERYTDLYIQAIEAGYSTNEIAEIVGTPVNTIRCRLRLIGYSVPRRSAKDRKALRSQSDFVLECPYPLPLDTEIDP